MGDKYTDPTAQAVWMIEGVPAVVLEELAGRVQAMADRLAVVEAAAREGVLIPARTPEDLARVKDLELTRAELVVANRDRHREHDARVKAEGEAEALRVRLEASESELRGNHENLKRRHAAALAEIDGLEADRARAVDEALATIEQLKRQVEAERTERQFCESTAGARQAVIERLEQQLAACTVAALGCGVEPEELPPEERSEAYRYVWQLRRMFEARREQARALSLDTGRIATLEDLRAALPVGLTVTAGPEGGLPAGAVLVTGPGLELSGPGVEALRAVLARCNVGELPTSRELAGLRVAIESHVAAEDDDGDDLRRRELDEAGGPGPLNLTRSAGALEEPDR